VAASELSRLAIPEALRNAGENAIRLAPAATHRMRATLRIE